MALTITPVPKSAASRIPIRAPQPAGLGRLRKVGILGSHHSLEYAPWHDPTWELWGHASSRFYYERQPDRYFDLHPKACWVMAHKLDKYMTWLRRNTVPIFMQAVDPEVPASVRFPKERILAEFRPYFTSHAAWMIALALTEGVTHIGMFGVNYSADSEYAFQRGSTEYWLGVAEGRGVTLVLPHRCTLLQQPKELYGYESHDETSGARKATYNPKTATITPSDGPPIPLTLLRAGEAAPKTSPPDWITAEEIAAAQRAMPKAYELVGAGA